VIQGVNNIAGVMAFLSFSCRLPWYKYCARLETERRKGKKEREREREKEKESEEVKK